MEYTLLRDVNSNTQSWRVRVRIARLWEHLDVRKNNELLRLQFVMVDEKGTSMQGSVAKPHLEKFVGKLYEGRAYYLRYLEIKQARDNYRAVENCYEAWLTKWTEITEISPVPESLPRYAYKIRSFQNLLATTGDKTNLADVVGIITGISDMVSIDVKGHSTVKRTLRLTDTRDTATVALWSKNAEAVNSKEWIDISSREPVVALVMGCTYKKQNSVLELSASYGSQVCINADISEIVALRDRFVGTAYPIELLAEKGRRFQSDEAEPVTVSQLASMNPHVAAGKKFRSKITITGLQPNQGWWFLSCDDCNWRAIQEGPTYKCTNDKCGGKNATPRYRLPIVAAECEASVNLVIFGDVARDLVGKDVDVLLAENYSLLSTVPSEVSGLIGKCYIVDVVVSRYSFRSTDICFQALKFYPEGSTVFVGHSASFMSVEKSIASQPSLSVQTVEEVPDSAKEKYPPVDSTIADGSSSTPPSRLIMEASQEEHPDEKKEAEEKSMDETVKQSKKGGGSTARKQLPFNDNTEKAPKKVRQSNK